VVYACKVFANITFQEVTVFLAECLNLKNGPVSPFPFAAGIVMINKRPVENRFYFIADGMVHNPISKIGSPDFPFLWLINAENAEGQRAVCFAKKFFPDAQKLFFKIKIEFCNPSPGLFPPERFFGRQKQVIERHNFFKEVPIPLQDPTPPFNHVPVILPTSFMEAEAYSSCLVER